MPGWSLERCCNATTMVLTLAYCAIVAHDLHQASPARLTSPAWFKRGFCTLDGGGGEGWLASTHVLCCIADLLGGTAIVLANMRRYFRGGGGSSCYRRPEVLVAAGVALFTVLHGLGHLLIYLVLSRGAGEGGSGSPDFMASLRALPEATVEIGALWLPPPSWQLLRLAAALCALFVFLAVGPALGAANGVGRGTCAALHVAQTVAFAAWVPTQFAFGAVQLVLNCWYCVPRLLLLHEPERGGGGGGGGGGSAGICEKGGDGASWRFAGVGMLLLMPVVFAEMLGCDDELLRTGSGGGVLGAARAHLFGSHLAYDASILLFLAAHSVVVWRECERRADSPGKRE